MRSGIYLCNGMRGMPFLIAAKPVSGRVAFGDIGKASLQQGGEIGGGQLNVYSALAAGDKDGVELAGGRINHRRQTLFCPSGLMPPTR